jgi:ferredoxin-nitrate reductase
MMEAAAVDKMDVLIICHTDPVYHLPDRHFVEMACKKIPMVVEINAYEGSETSAFAHIRLPALPFGFKDGTQTNLDRTLTRSQPLAYEGGVLQDWEIFAMLGRSLGFEQEFSFGSSKEVFAEYSSMTRLSEREHLNIFEADYDQLAAEPFVWGEGLFVDNDFLTDDHTAHLHTVLTGEGSEETDGEYPLIMLTGRTRDQWHSGSKTATDETLLRFKPLEFVEVSQADADKFGLRDGDSATIASRRGTIKATVIISDILEGVIFVPVSHRDINYLTPPIVDPVSKEPDYNHTAVKIS